jgi:hypothetical protein
MGAGTLYATRTDVANSTPVSFGILQNVSVEFSGDNASLYGQRQFPVLVARGKQKVTCKAENASINADLFNGLFFGATIADGNYALIDAEAVTVPASSTYNCTVAHAAAFTDDEGVYYVSTGMPLTKVVTPAAAGQYSVAAGVYTFSASDASAALYINYTYAVPSTGRTITVANPLQGVNPVFSVLLRQQATLPVKGVQWDLLKLHACVASKLTISTKQADFGIPSLDFEAFADSSGNIATWGVSLKA